MAQNDFTIDNQAFPATRSDINSALQALASLSSGASSPSTTFAYQLWVNTTADPNVLNIRNSANNAWIEIGEVNQSSAAFILTAYAYLQAGAAATPSHSFDDDRDTGMYRAAANIIGFATNGTERFRVADSGQLGIGGANYGTSGQVLTSGGASAAPSWANASAGAWKLISTQTASASSTIDFTGLSGYSRLRLTAQNITASSVTSDQYLRISSDNGATFLATTTYQNECAFATSLTGTGWQQSSNDSQFSLHSISGNTYTGMAYEFIISNFNIAQRTQLYGWSMKSSSSPKKHVFMSYQDGLTAMNAIRILQSTGTITTGTFILEGIVG